MPREQTPAGFTPERLRLIVSTIALVREEAQNDHVPEKGDDEWVFGCRAYRRSCHELLQLSRVQPWLKVVMEGLACTLLIDGVSIKFYRGDAEKPSSRVLRGAVQASYQHDFPFFQEEKAQEEDGWAWLLAIETDHDGIVVRGVLFEANIAGASRNEWLISPDPDVAVIAPVIPLQRDGVELSAPMVEAKSDPNAAEDEASDNDQGVEGS